jgi:hypothetical protein
VIDLTRQQARFGPQPVTLRGIKLALLAYYADAKLNRCVERERPVCGERQACFANPAQDEARFRELYGRLYTRTPGQFAEGGEGKLDSANLMSYHSRINGALGPLSLAVASRRQWGGTTYGLNLDKTRIEIIS